MNFIQSVKALLRVDTLKRPLTGEEQKALNLATVELMLEMVKADFVELHTEKKAMVDVLSQSLGMDASDVLKHIEKAELSSDLSLSIKNQTNVINNFLNKEEKAQLLKNMWLLAHADEELHFLEQQLFEQAGKLMGFSAVELGGICH